MTVSSFASFSSSLLTDEHAVVRSGWSELEHRPGRTGRDYSRKRWIAVVRWEMQRTRDWDAVLPSTSEKDEQDVDAIDDRGTTEEAQPTSGNGGIEKRTMSSCVVSSISHDLCRAATELTTAVSEW